MMMLRFSITSYQKQPNIYSSTMSMDYYYMPFSAPCRAVLLAARALDLELNLKLVDLRVGEQFKPEFVKLNPLHSVPVLVEDGLVLTESRAIITYLANKYGKGSGLYPEEPRARALVDQRLYFDVGTLYQRFFDYFYPPLFSGEPSDGGKLAKIEDALKVFDAYLQGQKYVAGDSLTIADLSLIATVSTFDVADIDFLKYPHIKSIMSMDYYYMPFSAPCRAVLLAARALDLELNLKLVDLRVGEQFKPEFVKLNPLHSVPVLVDDGLVLTESRAIITYLANKYGKGSGLYPEEPRARALVDQRLYFDVGTLYQRFFDYFYPPLFSGEPSDGGKLAKIEDALKVLDAYLQGQKYVAGDSLTIADLSLIATVSTFDVADIDFLKYPHIKRWYDTVRSTAPGYKAANEENLIGYKEFLNSIRK